MHCKVCGKELKEGSKKCSYCEAQKNKDKPSATSDKKPKKKGKYKLQLMDIITLSFTVIIVIIMIIVLVKTFKGNSDNIIQSNPTLSGSTASPAPTATPSLTDIGNSYGNMINEPMVVENDGRVYYIAIDASGIKSINVLHDDVSKILVKDNALYINVIEDPFTFADDPNNTAYSIFYIDADGAICSIGDGPVAVGTAAPTAMPTNAITQKVIIAQGKYTNLVVSGEWMYYIDGNGIIGKRNILTGSEVALSLKTYSSFILYYGSIYALSKEDSCIYELSTTARSAATPSPAPTSTAQVDEKDEYEFKLIDAKVNRFTIDSDWIYVVTDSGLARYSVDSGTDKDTLSSIKIDYINVSGENIFYISDKAVYTCTALNMMLEKNITKIGDINAEYINLTSEGVYVFNLDDHNLYKAAYSAVDKTYSAFEKVVAK